MDRTAALAADLDKRRALLALAPSFDEAWWGWTLVVEAMAEFYGASRPPVPRDWDRRPFRPVPRCRLIAGHRDGCILFLEDGAKPMGGTSAPSHSRFLSSLDAGIFCTVDLPKQPTPEQIVPMLRTIEAATRAVRRAKERAR